MTTLLQAKKKLNRFAKGNNVQIYIMRNMWRKKEIKMEQFNFIQFTSIQSIQAINASHTIEYDLATYRWYQNCTKEVAGPADGAA